MKKQIDKEAELRKLVELLEFTAPLVDRHENVVSIDQSGILDDSLIVDVEKLAVCIFPTMDVVETARQSGIDFLISHYTPRPETQTYMFERGMNGYVVHLSQDVAVNGNVYQLASHLGLKETQRENVSYNGRIVEGGMILGNPPREDYTEFGLEFTPQKRLENRIKSFQSKTDKVGGEFPGEDPKSYYFRDSVSKGPFLIAVSSGDSIRPSFLEQAKKKGADIYIGGGANAHAIMRAQELGMVVYDLGHYRTEVPGMFSLAERLGAVFIPNALSPQTSKKPIIDPTGAR